MVNKVLVILAICLFCVGAAYAQEEVEQMPSDFCTDEGHAYIAEWFEEALAALESGNDIDRLLMNVQMLIGTYRADCADLTFTSEEYGMDVVTDPIAFVSGFYRVTLEAADSTGVALTALEGNCGYLTLYASQTTGTEVQASASLEGCIGVLDVSGLDEWTLTFEPIVVPQGE